MESRYTDHRFLRLYSEREAVMELCPFPDFIIQLGNLKGKRVLDIGCGQGVLPNIMAQRGAIVTGIDISSDQIEISKNRYGDRDNPVFKVMDAVNMDFTDNLFDAATMNMVLLNVPTIDSVGKIIRETSRVLRPDGKLIFTDLHPITILRPEKPRSTKLSGDFSYFRDGDEYTAQIDLGEGRSIEFHNKHWTIKSYKELLAKADMYVENMSEPTYGKESPTKFRELNQPEYIMFVCRKKK